MMQILEVVLYGKNDKKRSIKFKENTVNIIQSLHNTGKSSLIEIIDYCLGEHDNQIKSSLVNDLVSWFGLVINVNQTRLFIARQNHQFGHSTDLMYLEKIHGFSPEQPPVRNNISRKQFVNFLSDELDISEIPLEYKEDEYITATIRHSLFFCYLTQNEISTTDFLYHKSHSGFIDIQTRMVLEYFLGSFDDDIFDKYMELTKIERDLVKVSKKLKEFEIIKGDAAQMADELLGKCRKHGLYESDEMHEELIDYISDLKNIVSTWKPDTIPSIAPELAGLHDKIFDLKEQLKEKNELLQNLKKYSDITEDFKSETEHQRNRLELIELFNSPENNHTCPLCSNKFDNIPKQVDQIKNDFVQIQNNLGETKKVKHYVGKLVEQTEEEKSKIKNEINQISTKLKGFLDEQVDTKKIFDENIRISEIMGEIKLWLHSVENTNESSQLGKEKKKLELQKNNLKKQIQLNEQSVNRKLILDSISKNITKWAKDLNITDSTLYQMQFVVNTIKLFYNQNKILDFANLGGGHNMLGIHLILYLSLHEHFLRNNRPVPNFIIFDQPSTPYFTQDPTSGTVGYKNDNERQALFTDFKFIIEKAEQMKNLQVIITDQAKFNEDWFTSRIVQDWGDGLIPKSWIPNKQS
jgi:hypothetical protein